MVALFQAGADRYRFKREVESASDSLQGSVHPVPARALSSSDPSASHLLFSSCIGHFHSGICVSFLCLEPFL